MARRARWAGWAVAVWTTVSAGCDDPTALRPAPATDRAMILFMALDPDAATQPLFIEAVDVAGEFEGFVRAELRTGSGELIAVQEQARVPDIEEPDGPDLIDILQPCARRYGGLGSANPVTCFNFDFRPRHGETYRLRVTAEGRMPAEASTQVPDSFELISVEARGRPPGTDGLEVAWTRSEDAYRYLVALRSDSVVCYNIRGCLDGWFETTDTTALRATVPATELDAGSGPWRVDVYAVDRALYEYFTTGSGGDLFAIPPVQNVDGGYGVFGAWLRRSRPLTPGIGATTPPADDR